MSTKKILHAFTLTIFCTNKHAGKDTEEDKRQIYVQCHRDIYIFKVIIVIPQMERAIT